MNLMTYFDKVHHKVHDDDDDDDVNFLTLLCS